MASAIAPTALTRQWITLNEAGRRLGCSRRVITHLVRDGYLSTRRVGYWTKVDAAQVEALDRRSVREATAPRQDAPKRRSPAAR